MFYNFTIRFISSVGPVDLEAKFTPNYLNTTVYIISMALQVCTFAVNYRVCVLIESHFYL